MASRHDPYARPWQCVEDAEKTLPWDRERPLHAGARKCLGNHLPDSLDLARHWKAKRTELNMRPRITTTATIAINSRTARSLLITEALPVVLELQGNRVALRFLPQPSDHLLELVLALAADPHRVALDL